MFHVLSVWALAVGLVAVAMVATSKRTLLRGPLGLLFVFLGLPTLAKPLGESMLYWIVLGVAVVFWIGNQGNAKTFAFSVALFFGLFSWIGARDAQQFVRYQSDLKEAFPVVSLAQRLPIPRIEATRLTSKTGKENSPTTIENNIGEVLRESTTRFFGRTKNLKQLHEQQFGVFVDSPGFGISRMPTPNKYNLQVKREKGTPKQSGLEPSTTWSPGEVGPVRKLAGIEHSQFRSVQDSGIVDFVNPEGFGYFEDRDHVAGFEAHRFSKSPELPDGGDWKLARVYLLGLVVHTEPRVYVTDTLPTMENVKQTPTRDLDAFERAGLESLRAGEELFWRGDDRQLRLLGAIRAARQCTQCHGCERGQLLGAFTYYLVPNAPKRTGN